MLLLNALLCGFVMTLACSAQLEDCCKFPVGCPQVAAYPVVCCNSVSFTSLGCMDRTWWDCQASHKQHGGNDHTILVYSVHHAMD